MTTPLKNIRQKMCAKKMAFRTEGAALRVAEKFEHRVYECPICFCWHTTSKKDGFHGDMLDWAIRRAEQTVRAELKKKVKELNLKISELQKENSDLRRGKV